MLPTVPSFRGPASIGVIVMLAGFALVYWSLTGLGVIAGDNATARAAALKGKLTTR